LELGTTTQRTRRRLLAGEPDRAVGAAHTTSVGQRLRAADERTHPRCSNWFDTKARLGAAAACNRPRRNRQQDQGARLGLVVPGANLGDGLAVADQHRVDEVAEQLFCECGVVAVGTNEVGQRTEYPVAVTTALGQQGSGGGCDADPITLERLECAL